MLSDDYKGRGERTVLGQRMTGRRSQRMGTGDVWGVHGLRLKRWVGSKPREDQAPGLPLALACFIHPHLVGAFPPFCSRPGGAHGFTCLLWTWLAVAAFGTAARVQAAEEHNFGFDRNWLFIKVRKQSKRMEEYLDSDDFEDLKFYMIVRGKGKPIEALLELKGREKKECWGMWM